MHKLDIEKTSLIAGGASNRNGDLFRAAKEGAVDGALLGMVAAYGMVLTFQAQGQLRMSVREIPLFFAGVSAVCAAVFSSSKVLHTYFSSVKDEQD